MTELSLLRQAHQQRKAAELQALLNAGTSARSIPARLRRFSQITDELLHQLWTLSDMPAHAALVAVGGYGRGELFPHSDVDVLILLPDPDSVCALSAQETSQQEEKLGDFVRNCWDTGLEIGSSVRTVSECLRESQGDITVQTALLESRLLCGDTAVFAQFESAYAAHMDANAFRIAKTLELRQRHTRFENTPYSLEPNCKESPGGLRDLQTVMWIARAAGLGRSWKELADNGIATPFEVQQITRNEAVLSLIRARLHVIAGRREDRLVFDQQTAVAESLGYRSTTPDGQRLPMRASETLMRRYYWAAKAVTQLSQILMLNLEERLQPPSRAPRRINDRFLDKDGRIEVSSEDLYLRDPHAILETFLLYQGSGALQDLSARTLRALYGARKVMDGQFRRDPINRAAFLRILQQPEGITHAMRLMNQTSVLGRTLWPFRRIVGQMQHDLFHVYTVDQHTLMVLRNVRRFFIAEHAHEYPFCSQLAAGWDKPWILYIAALFHDIGKGRGGDHSQIGALEARRFARAYGLEREDSELIQFLVREHLCMSQVAQKQDLSDPDVINAFAQRMGSERHLTALYLLTVADVRGTSPKVWNAWKGKLLEDLFHATLRALGGRAPDASAQVEQRKREALSQLALRAQPYASHNALWDTLDVSYFMRHDANEIAWHARQLSRHVNSARPLVSARPSAAGAGLQVMVYTPDRADLFARICGYFDHAGFSIQDARIYTTRTGHALDTFQVESSDPSSHYREITPLVETGLAQAVEAAGPLPGPCARRVSRRVRSFPFAPRIRLQPDEKAQRWLLSISASDRAGLLFTVAKVLARHKLRVQLAKVSTLGERVEDTFLLEGDELQHSGQQIEIETELIAALSA